MILMQQIFRRITANGQFRKNNNIRISIFSLTNILDDLALISGQIAYCRIYLGCSYS